MKSSYEQALVVDLLQRPPDALDVVVRHRLVRVAEVGPIGDPLGEALPVGHVPQDALATPRVELVDAVGLDVALGLQAEFLLDLELDRKAVTVPATAAGNGVAAHRLVARIDVFEDAGQHVVHARPAVRRRRPFVDDVLVGSLAGRDGAGEHVLVAPSLEDLSLERGHIDLRSNRAEDGHAGNDIGRWGAPRSIREPGDVVEDGRDGPVLRLRVRPRSSRRGVLGTEAGMLRWGWRPRPKGARQPRRHEGRGLVARRCPLALEARSLGRGRARSGFSSRAKPPRSLRRRVADGLTGGAGKRGERERRNPS